MTTKPARPKSISPDHFKNYYWLKTELINFCKKYGLSSSGSKTELTERINILLTTGLLVKPESKETTRRRDSEQPINRKTLVINYKNDMKTKVFFVSQIGSRFHFNSYLRQFTNRDNITTNLTYGDLVEGWRSEEAKKKEASHQTIIGNQFEYNQFTRDFFTHELGKTRQAMIMAWRTVSSIAGPNTYAFYKSLMKEIAKK